MRSTLLNSLFRTERLASKPRLWGKLPAYGDYVQLRISIEEARAWQDWVGKIWVRRDVARPFKTKPKQNAKSMQWIRIDQPERPMVSQRLPVAFVIPPGEMSFNPKHYLQGVMVASRHKIGRECPLIVYQLVAPHWARQYWRNHDHADGRHLLFWLSQLIGFTNTDLDFGRLAEAVEKVCEEYQPGWMQRLGAAMKQPDIATINHMLAQVGVEEDEHGYALQGVRYLPWTDWPERTLRGHQPIPAFWVQDAQARYLTASDALSRLWCGERS